MSSKAEKIIDASHIKLIKVVGHGSFGQVWKAKYKGATVAVKRTELESTEEEVLQEAETWLAVNDHPNLAR